MGRQCDFGYFSGQTEIFFIDVLGTHRPYGPVTNSLALRPRPGYKGDSLRHAPWMKHGSKRTPRLGEWSFGREQSMKATFLAVSVCLVVFLITGCTTPVRPGMVSFFDAPASQAVRSPDMESRTYQKFTTTPTAKEVADSGMHPVVEKQLLYMVRNELESLGYQYVENPKESDFSVRLTYSNEHKRGAFEQSQTRSVLSVSGGSGVAESRGMAKTHSSFCPTLAVCAVDTDTNREIWSGSALAETPNPEIRLSANHLLSTLARRFPMAAHASETLDLREGIFGCDFRILTPNGDDCFPVVTGLLVGSPARNKLQVYDVITGIDGNSTKNRPYSEIRAAFDKKPGERVSLTLNRNGKSLTIALVAAEEATIRYLDLLAADYSTGQTLDVPLSSIYTQSNLTKEALLNLVP